MYGSVHYFIVLYTPYLTVLHFYDRVVNFITLFYYSIQYILNISKEIDNFFPGILHYYNIKEWDSEETDMLKYWENTHKYINKVRYVLMDWCAQELVSPLETSAWCCRCTKMFLFCNVACLGKFTSRNN